MNTRARKISGAVSIVLLVGALGFYLYQIEPGNAGFMGASDPNLGFSQLRKMDRERLSAQRHLVFEEAQRRYGTVEFFQDERDLDVLQRLIDERAFLPSQTYELQSLGVVFGDVFANRPEFEWKIVTDEYGRDPTLRYRSTDAHLNALTMISKRIERSETIDVTDLYEHMISYFAINDPEITR